MFLIEPRPIVFFALASVNISSKINRIIGKNETAEIKGEK